MEDVLYGAISAIILAIGTFVSKWLNAKASSDKEDSEQSSWNRLQTVTLSVAASVAARSFPALARRVKSGEITSSAQIKAALYELGGIAYEEVKAIAPDLVSKYGKDAVTSLIRMAADRVNPFKGQETAEALLSNPDAVIEGKLEA